MITADQLKKVLLEARLGLTETETDELFAKFEYKKSGKLRCKDVLDALKVSIANNLQE